VRGSRAAQPYEAPTWSRTRREKVGGEEAVSKRKTPPEPEEGAVRKGESKAEGKGVLSVGREGAAGMALEGREEGERGEAEAVPPLEVEGGGASSSTTYSLSKSGLRLGPAACPLFPFFPPLSWLETSPSLPPSLPPSSPPCWNSRAVTGLGAATASPGPSPGKGGRNRRAGRGMLIRSSRKLLVHTRTRPEAKPRATFVPSWLQAKAVGMAAAAVRASFKVPGARA